ALQGRRGAAQPDPHGDAPPRPPPAELAPPARRRPAPAGRGHGRRRTPTARLRVCPVGRALPLPARGRPLPLLRASVVDWRAPTDALRRVRIPSRARPKALR